MVIEVLVACGGFGWPPKKTEQSLNGNKKKATVVTLKQPSTKVQPMVAAAVAA